MERRKRNLLVVLIGIVIVVAMVSSFGLGLFAPDTAKIVLPTPEVSQQPGGEPGEQSGLVLVDVTPETVQSVIRDTLSRPDRYTRAVTIEDFWGEGESGTTHADVWVDGGWTQTEAALPGGTVRYSIVGDGQFWLWYGGDRTALSGPADGHTADLEGPRIPTDEDGLELEQKYIVADTQPWDQFQDEVMGVLRRMGCTVERQGDVRQRDVYYDTADDALLRGGCSLRMRTAGEAALLTWKGKPAERQGGLFARREEELPVFDGDLRGERVRTFLRSCLAELPGTGPEMLKRCAEVENHRRLVRVADGGGVYELAFDEVAYTGPAGGHPCRERQMELEHKAGGSEGLARLAAALQSALPGLVCAQGSKYQRARTLLG